jgi:hypothetical protein
MDQKILEVMVLIYQKESKDNEHKFNQKDKTMKIKIKKGEVMQYANGLERLAKSDFRSDGKIHYAIQKNRNIFNDELKSMIEVEQKLLSVFINRKKEIEAEYKEPIAPEKKKGMDERIKALGVEHAQDFKSRDTFFAEEMELEVQGISKESFESLSENTQAWQADILFPFVVDNVKELKGKENVR